MDTWVCVASGPSLTVDQVNYCHGRAHVMTVNTSYQLAPWADALYSCDYYWWAHHFATIRERFFGACWTRNSDAARDYNLRLVHGERGEGLNREPWTINQGHNSGYQAINLVWHLGAKRIILIGYDMQKTGGLKHWFGDHPGKMNREPPFEKWIQAYKPLARDLKDAGVDVINCTRETALPWFRQAALEDVL